MRALISIIGRYMLVLGNRWEADPRIGDDTLKWIGRLKGVCRALLFGSGTTTRLVNYFEYLLNDFRVENCSAVERDRNPETAFSVNAMAAFRPEKAESRG